MVVFVLRVVLLGVIWNVVELVLRLVVVDIHVVVVDVHVVVVVVVHIVQDNGHQDHFVYPAA